MPRSPKKDLSDDRQPTKGGSAKMVPTSPESFPAQAVEIRWRPVTTASRLKVSGNPAPAVRLALAFDAWARSLPMELQSVLARGVNVTVPIPDVDDDGIATVLIDEEETSGPRVDPWDHYFRRRNRVESYNTTDFLCEFATLYKETTNRKYAFRGGLTGTDYKLMYGLRQHFGNDTLRDAIIGLMKEWTRQQNGRGTLNIRSAPTLGALSAFINDILALKESSTKHGEQAEAKKRPAVSVPAEDDAGGATIQ